MGRSSLKQTLNQQAQMLEREFTALAQSIPSSNDLQVRSLETLSFNIRRLTTSIDALPLAPLLHTDRHEIRNQLTVIQGYAQVLMHRRAGDLPVDAAVHLQKMVILVSRINDSLDQDQAEAHN